MGTDGWPSGPAAGAVASFLLRQKSFSPPLRFGRYLRFNYEGTGRKERGRGDRQRGLRVLNADAELFSSGRPALAPRGSTVHSCGLCPSSFRLRLEHLGVVGGRGRTKLMVKKVCCGLTRTRRRVSDLSELDAPLYDDTSFYRRHALVIGAAIANASDCNPPPPRIRPPHHIALAQDRGIVKPTPRRGMSILGAAAPGLSGCRLVGARLAHDYDGSAPHSLCEPTSGASSPQSDSGDSSPQSDSCDSSPRAPLDFGLDIGAQINVFMRDMRTTASTTASLDLLAPLAGLSCGQTTADLAEHLGQLVCH